MAKKIMVNFKKIIFITFASLFAILVALVIFIKVDTQAAAQFTDNYLRPLIGNKNVILLEKNFYNASDKFTQITNKNGASPIYTESDQVAPVGGDLNVNPIPINPKLIPLKNEGVWFWKKLNIFPNQEVLAYTFVRPDITRPYANVTLLQADMGPFMLGSVGNKPTRRAKLETQDREWWSQWANELGSTSSGTVAWEAE